MASQWFCRVLGQEMGPLTFQGLVQMVHSGTLTEDDPVRRMESNEWTAAREVIGLFRAARQQPAEAEPAQGPGAPDTTEDPSPKSRRIGKRELTWGGGGLVLLLAILAVWGWWATRTPRFPKSEAREIRPVDEQFLDRMRAPRPEVPSVAGLDKRVPELIPGLEEVIGVYSLCLTSDLCTIVYSGLGHPGTLGDLCIATREDATRPFGKPAMIYSCSSVDMEERPALSPDGLEMIFVRQFEDEWQFFYTSRETLSSEFAEPDRWLVPVLATPTQRLRTPRFLDPLHVTFSVVDSASKEQWTMITERPAPKSAFGPPQDLPLWKVGPRAFYSEDGLRAYFGMGQGLFLISRRTPNERFGRGSLMMETAVTGPITTPVWVASQEDVIFYGSPGPGKKPGSGSKLWMIRF